jgi:hypothetical protein
MRFDTLNQQLRIVRPLAVRARVTKVGARLRCALGICSENNFDFRPVCFHPAGQLKTILGVAKHDANRLGRLLQYSQGLGGAARFKNAITARAQIIRQECPGKDVPFKDKNSFLSSTGSF